ncbi:MAG: hypothetical protein GXO77_03530 [Calditrichaeota bacterium]|nr:hypothetical protein [Calditrichota bacterium]
MARMKVGLILGGGGARGLAHIGVIKRLLHYGIPIDVITGASMGAIVGAAYALNSDILKVEQVFRDFINSDKFRSLRGESVDLSNVDEPENFIRFISNIVKRRIIINLAVNRKSLIAAERLEFALKHLVPQGHIENAAIPFGCSALDLISGKEIVFTKGNIHKAIKASSSIPGFLPPVDYNRRQLVDGAVIDNFPIRTAKELGADFLIVCDVSSQIEPVRQLDNVIDIFIRSYRAAVHRLNNLLLTEANFVLVPEIGDVNWTQFEDIDFLIKKGEEIVDKNIIRLKGVMKQHNRFSERIKRWTVRKFQKV